MIRSFRDLEVYKHSKRAFAELVNATKNFPASERYLATQLNRAANSVHANIAEGFGRSEAEFKQYLRRALGSNNEVISHLEDALTLKCLRQEAYDALSDEYTVLGKQLYRLRENWRSQ